MLEKSYGQAVNDSRKSYEEQFEKRYQESRENFRQFMEERQQWFDRQMAEQRAGRRWVVATIVTCALGLASYMSVLFHLLQH